MRLIKIWKDSSTISARHPQFSGKDSGNGDSDSNDSDSDRSADELRKGEHQNKVQNGISLKHQ